VVIQARQVHLVRKYLRASDGSRICRLLFRLPIGSLADLFSQLNERELRQIASAVTDEDTLSDTVAHYDDEALLMVLEAASEAASVAILVVAGVSRANNLLRRTDEARAFRLVRALSQRAGTRPEKGPEVHHILRLRRIFS
jgi:Mg/Co/Ni transporter MgtE